MRERASAEGLPDIAVSSNLGRFLQVLVLASGARRALEIGTLGGYSATWIARGLPPEGTLVTLEYDGHHVDVARRNLAAAGLDARVEVRAGKALDSLALLEKANQGPFDFVFIDAGKAPYAEYLEAAIRLLGQAPSLSPTTSSARGR